ncbi:hypothetical protein B0T19DRAFT_94038 [Cercophora scortea]|uniref:Uncharacterized protein n=1 Tax=Cercophora scortea TaxID=314031 RepID=A0AAE0MH68_9PEZI|nr:hypothetical protein B0T19DRAFT_94038 [Cercophora scortea]
MMEVLGTPSPGPSTEIHTPPAPHHGYEDSWQPYSTRHSARISQRATARNRTPSPNQSTRHNPDQRQHSLGSPRSSKKHLKATMASPAISPQKKRFPTMESSRLAPGTVTAEGAANAAASLGLSPAQPPRAIRSAISTNAGMLITPAKTPQKPPTDQNKAKINSIARNLFNDDTEIMPSPKKTRAQKYTLDSFSAEDEVDEPIEIFTDSHERIPVVDRSVENPFYGETSNAAPEPPKRRSKRHTVTIPGEGRVTVDEAIRRDDGMLIVFRGKKQFRKFSENDDAASSREALDGADGGLESVVESSRRPLTRSAVKPRLLFPTSKPEVIVHDDDEEAVTDIEDHVLAGKDEEEHPITPLELLNEGPNTPEAPRFAPASPPSTARTTRLGSKKAAGATTGKTGPRDRRSLFDSWARVKNPSSSESHSHKRSGDALADGPAKRTRA